jgi:uncharacterized protein (UPF0332 family)
MSATIPPMRDIDRPFIIKALECIAGAESELANGRYNNCANRCYYACFQAAIDALEREGIRPSGATWSHAFVPSQFDGLLVSRRKRYGAELHGILGREYILRQRADYAEKSVTAREARQAVDRARIFVRTILDDESSAR